MLTITLGIITTTANQLDNRQVREHHGIVCGDAILCAAGAEGSLLSFLDEAWHVAIRALAQAALRRGASAVLGIQLKFAPIEGGRLLVSAIGTAVRL